MDTNSWEAARTRLEQLEAANKTLEEKLATTGRQLLRLSVWLRAATGFVAMVAVAGAVLIGFRMIDFLGGNAPEDPFLVKPQEVEFHNRAGDNTLLLFNDKYGTPHVFFLDAKKNARLSMNVNEIGEPSVDLYGANGVRGQFKLDASGSVALTLTGDSKKGGVSLKVGPEGDPKLTLTNRDGAVLFEAPKAQEAPSGP